MHTIASTDGTTIAYDKAGQGHPLILVDGALCSRAGGPMPKLAPLLAEHFTVYTYDRRGRNDSGDSPPYAIEREVEDLKALMAVAGGRAHLYGISSGAVLALEAAASGLPVDKLVVYEPPFIVDDSRAPLPPDYLERMRRLLADDRRGDAVRYFMAQVGVPRIFAELMRLMPAWRKLKAIAPTLVYDATLMAGTQDGKRLPADRFRSVTTPTLVAVGGKSPDWMRAGARALVDLLPDAREQVVEGQTHMLKAKAIAPVLIDFLAPALRSAPSRSSAPAPASARRTPAA